MPQPDGEGLHAGAGDGLRERPRRQPGRQQRLRDDQRQPGQAGGAPAQPRRRPAPAGRRAGCLSAERKAPCTKLSSGEESTLALSPDGKQAYLASGGEDDVSIYARSPSGVLRPQQRCIPYQGAKPCGPTDDDQFISLTPSPDGGSLYLVEGVDDRIVAFTRDPDTGRLTKLPGPFGCGRSTPCPGGLSVASSVSFAPDSQVAYYALQSSSGGGFGGVVLYGHSPDGALNPVEGPFGCVAQSPGDCQAAPGIRDPGGLVFSADGHNAYVSGREGITAFSVAPPA